MSHPALPPIPGHFIILHGDTLTRFFEALPRPELEQASKAAGFDSAEALLTSLTSSVLFQGWTEDSIKSYLAFRHQGFQESTIDAFFPWFADSGGEFDIEPTAAELFAMVDSAFDSYLETLTEAPSGTGIATPTGEIQGMEALV